MYAKIWADTAMMVDKYPPPITTKRIGDRGATLLLTRPPPPPLPPPLVLEDLDSFSAANKWCATNRVAVLNFGNPTQPALGKPRTGTQEEDLMRRSTLGLSLYRDLKSGDFNGKSEFYPIKTNEVLYSSKVIVFKDSAGKLIEPFVVDVVTACALIFPKKSLDETSYANESDRETMRSIIRNIYATSYSCGAEVVIMGAFGCGAFSCPIKETVELLVSEARLFPFKTVVFAVPKSFGGVAHSEFQRQIANMTAVK